MRGFITNIESDTLYNSNFRKVLYTAEHSQLVLMSLAPGEEIGTETHTLDQFFRIEKGYGKAILNGEEADLSDGTAIVVPAGTEHNIINTGSEPLKLYTLYCPPEHKHGVVHATKADAQADTYDHYDGYTSV